MKTKALLSLVLASVLLSCDKVPNLGPATQTKLATASEEDCGFVQNNFGQRVSWNQHLPVKFYIDPSFPNEYDEVLKRAAQKWEKGLQRTLFTFERVSKATKPARDQRNVVYWLNPWNESETKLQAVSSLSWANNQLVESDIKVDAQYFNFYVDIPSNNYEVHLESLLVHELGHVLGLKHVSNNVPSVMFQVLDYLIKRETPSAEDLAHLKCEYN